MDDDSSEFASGRDLKFLSSSFGNLNKTLYFKKA
jgi:hypothetical protein